MPQFSDYTGSLTIWQLNVVNLPRILLAAVHFPSRVNYSQNDQTYAATEMANDIKRTEQDAGIFRTLVVGDFKRHTMADTIPDLWPTAALKIDVRPPIVILRAQATRLTQNTQGILVGEVTAASESNGQMTLGFDVIAPALNNYRYRLRSNEGVNDLQNSDAEEESAEGEAQEA